MTEPVNQASEVVGEFSPLPPSGPVIETPEAVPNPDPLVGTVTDLSESEAFMFKLLRTEEQALRAEIDAITGNLREKFIALHERTRDTWKAITKTHGLKLTKRVYSLTRKSGKAVLIDMGPIPEGPEFDFEEDEDNEENGPSPDSVQQ